MPPRVSVIMTVHNGEDTIREAVRSLLDQSWRDLEVVVVEDGSTDRTADVLREMDDPRVRVIPAGRVGRTPALNLALGAATGELVAVLDADDVAMPDRIAKQVSYLDDHPEAVAVATWYRRMDESGTVTGPFTVPADHDALVDTFPYAEPVAHSSVMYRRAAASQAGGYPSEYPYAQDFGLYQRLVGIGRFGVLAEVLVTMREYGTRMSVSPDYELARLDDALRLFRQAQDLPGVSAASRARGRLHVTRLMLQYADALCRAGRYLDGMRFMAWAALRHPGYVGHDPYFQSRVLTRIPGMLGGARALARTARKVLGRG